ncbi:MAG: hypothetical protein RLZZ450_1650 [Pseudomonadota bacterium]|jgi:hypothetical protein
MDGAIFSDFCIDNYTGEPTILFPDGTACINVNIVLFGGGVNRADAPKDWTQWRAADAGVAILHGSTWRSTRFCGYAPAPKGLTLAGTFSDTSGSSGSMSAFLAQKSFVLSKGGRFTQTAYVASVTSNSVVSGGPADKQGSYAIDGYTIALHYDGGSAVTTSFVWKSLDPRMFWLDRHGYVSGP